MLESLKLRFDPVEDRLVLTVASRDGDQQREQAFHITRRVCFALHGDLKAMMAQSAQAPEKADPVVKAGLAAANHQALAAQAQTWREPVRTEAAQTPPLLVTEVRCGRERSSGRWVMQLKCSAERHVTLALTDQTLHGFIQAYNERVTGAGWGLPQLPTTPPMDKTQQPSQFH